MFPLSLLPNPAAFAIKPINALLSRESWAVARLRAHSGKIVRFDIGVQSLSLEILPEGSLRHADAAVAPSVTLSLPPGRWSDVPSVLRARDPAALAGLMHVQGDAALAQVVSDLARDLRWDVEDDLAQLVGDVAAVRITSGARRFAGGVQDAAWRFLGNAGEYLSEESGMLLSRPPFDHWSGHVAELQSRLAAMEHRIAALSKRRAAAVRATSRPAAHTPKSRAC